MKKTRILKKIRYKNGASSDSYAKFIVALKPTLLMLTCTFLFLSLVSYSPLDTCLSVSSNFRHKAINICGYYGAVVADLLLQFFGLSSWVILIIILIWATSLLSLLFKRSYTGKAVKLGLMEMRFPFATLAILSCATGLGFFKSYNFAMQMLPGGYVGHYVSLILSHKIGDILGFTMCMIVFFISFIVSIHPPVKQNLPLITKIKAMFSLFAVFGSAVMMLSTVAVGFVKLIKSFLSLAFEAPKVILEAVSDSNANKENKQKRIESIRSIQDIAKDSLPASTQSETTLLSSIMQQNNEKPYEVPTSLLSEPEPRGANVITFQERERRKMELLQTLSEFGVKGDVLSSLVGPVVTMYELKPEAGTKAARVINLSNDIARALKVPTTRIADVPSRGIIGIELPNVVREKVFLRELLESNVYKASRYAIPLVFGKDIKGDPVVEDLTKMPHLLIAGATGSGKSVGLNGMILSVLYKLSPEECRFIMIDPKMLELSPYDGIPHLLHPVITDPLKAIGALKWVVNEMITRYGMMSSIGVRNITGYNQKASIAISRGAKIVREIEIGYNAQTKQIITEQIAQEACLMPYIVVVIDEVADLMMIAGKELEALIQRLAQMARAAGIHVIMATQRPSVDVITGTIKSNFPTRVAYQVASKIDSRTILGEQGAEQLLGKGDMLYSDVGKKPQRVHGPFVSDEEVETVVKFLKEISSPMYVDLSEVEESASAQHGTVKAVPNDSSRDKFYQEALEIVINEGKTSISYIQRRLGIGYNKAANIIEEMERNGTLSKPDRTGKRVILNENIGG